MAIMGFSDLNGGRPLKPIGVGPPVGRDGPFSSVGGGPTSAPKTPAAPPSMPYGQKNDPQAYGAPGAPGSSPLGMWQNWLNTMGPYMAQMPVNEPNVESGGLSSLAPSSASPGTLRGYSGPDTPWMGRRGFMQLQ